MTWLSFRGSRTRWRTDAKPGLIGKPGSSFLLFLTITLLGVISLLLPVLALRSSNTHLNIVTTRYISDLCTCERRKRTLICNQIFLCCLFKAHCLGDNRLVCHSFQKHIRNLPNESCRPQYGVGVYHVIQVPLFIFGILLDVNIECKTRYILKY